MARGPAQEDQQLFAPEQVPALRTAVAELAWLLDRGYPPHASLELVGNRHELRARQRTAVLRCTCTDAQAAERRARALAPAAIAGRPLAIDGFNLLIAVESALAGGVILRGRDDVVRDMASVHGSYRRSVHTLIAATAIGERLLALAAGPVTWLLDRPVSNSGRLAAALEALAQERGWPWTVTLDNDPDRRLVALAADDPARVIASGDAWILDHAPCFVDLAADVIAQVCPEAWILDLGASIA